MENLEVVNIETKVITDYIKNYKTNNQLLVRINTDKETFKQSYEFLLSFDELEGFEVIENTFNITTLNNVLKYCLNNDMVVSFDTNYY